MSKGEIEKAVNRLVEQRPEDVDWGEVYSIGRAVKLTDRDKETVSSGDRVTFYDRGEGHSVAIDVESSTSRTVTGVSPQTGLEYQVSRELLVNKIVFKESRNMSKAEIERAVDEMVGAEEGLTEAAGDLLRLVGKKKDDKLTTSDARTIGQKVAKMTGDRQAKYLSMIRTLGGYKGGGKGSAEPAALRSAAMDAYNKVNKAKKK